MTITFLVGDARDVLPTLPAASARCCVTPPPYLWQRDYGDPRQIGAESTIAEYVVSLVAVFREVRRVLTPDGTLWLNLDDTRAVRWSSRRARGRAGLAGDDATRTRPTRPGSFWRSQGVAEGSVLLVPARVALALIEDGWILRSDDIWSKPNPRPDPARSRASRSHEYLFQFSVGRRPYYDRLAALPRSVKSIAVEPSGRDVTAAMPARLAASCILASSAVGDLIVDPFGGVGTTARVAQSLGRRAISIELSARIDALARSRVA